MPSTTKILVKLVVSSSSAGATDNAVTARMIRIELDGLLLPEPVPPIWMLTPPDDGAVGFEGALGSACTTAGAAKGTATGTAATKDAVWAGSGAAEAGAASAKPSRLPNISSSTTPSARVAAITCAPSSRGRRPAPW